MIGSEIHEAFRMCRTPGTYRADPAEETRHADGTITVRQWVFFPEVGWSLECATYSPKARVEAMLRASCVEIDRWAKRASPGELLARLEAEGCSVWMGGKEDHGS